MSTSNGFDSSLTGLSLTVRARLISSNSHQPNCQCRPMIVFRFVPGIDATNEFQECNLQGGAIVCDLEALDQHFFWV